VTAILTGRLSARNEILRDKIPVDEIFQIVREGAVLDSGGLDGECFNCRMNAEARQYFGLGFSFDYLFFHQR